VGIADVAPSVYVQGGPIKKSGGSG
jgi:hypothetical protein